MSKTIKDSSLSGSEQGLVDSINILADMIDNSEGQDFAGISSEDMSVPFLRILQDMSPQVKSGPAHIEGAKAGALYNSTTERVWSSSVLFVPCSIKKIYVEWIPRAAGGGFVAAYETDREFSQATRVERAWMLPNGHEVTPTILIYGILCAPNESPLSVVIPFNKTQLKKSRQWISIMALQSVVINGVSKRPRIYSYLYKLSTTIETKDSYTWFGWVIDKAPTLIKDPNIFNTAKNFATLLNEGKASAKLDDMGDAETEDTSVNEGVM